MLKRNSQHCHHNWNKNWFIFYLGKDYFDLQPSWFDTLLGNAGCLEVTNVPVRANDLEAMKNNFKAGRRLLLWVRYFSLSFENFCKKINQTTMCKGIKISIFRTSFLKAFVNMYVALSYLIIIWWVLTKFVRVVCLVFIQINMRCKWSIYFRR